MRKRSASHDLGACPSPGAPQYRGAAGFQRGWASERVQPQTGRAGRQIGFAAMSFSSGRAVPSKWEDAERWICSPFNANANANAAKSLNSVQPHKRPKSKSGPIVQGTTGFSSYVHSPAEHFSATLPFSTGVLAAESVFGGGSVALSRVPGWPDFKDGNYCCPSSKISLSSESNEQEINPEAGKSEESSVSRGVSQRDMATQMSPRDCRCGQWSGVGKSSPSALISISEQQNDEFGKLEVRDVEVDKRAVAIRWSRKRGSSRMISKKGHCDANEFGEDGFDISQAATDDLKWQREEAKITAWENLQKAKAEAAIRKLEMKLEKKRSATMDRIVDKLRTAEFKAHRMRTRLSDEQTDNREAYQVSRTTPKSFSFRKNVWVGSLSRIFMCRAF